MQTFEKGAQVLRAFTPDRPEWGARELAAASGLTRSTAHAYLQSLARAGFLRRTDGGRYRLSWRLLELTSALHGALGWWGAARFALGRLANETRSLGFLCVLEEGRVVCADRALGDPGADLALVQTDVSLPPHATAAGKVLYAFAALPAPAFSAFTRSTITTADEWATELARVRDLGLAHAIEEWTAGQCALAAPIRSGGEVVACLGLQFPLGRLDREGAALRAALLDTTDRLSASPGQPEA